VRVADELASRVRERIVGGARAKADELADYQGLVRYLLFERHRGGLDALIERAEQGLSTTVRVPEYKRYREDVERFLELPGVQLSDAPRAVHLFACAFQIRRAFDATFRAIYGGSLHAARVRADIWNSVFTHDPERYRRALYERMGDVTTLILGESGTGKELAARAIALSRYVPFDEEKQRFVEDYARSFHAVNLSALSPTIIESELFGHRRGAFTGAAVDRVGWLEVCSARGTVFLDEIGELDGSIQVKLLRLLQSRTFQRVGETQERRFLGKIVAATNRDLEREMSEGRFRADFYYRFCADVIRTSNLREQLAESPDDLPQLVTVLCKRIVGPEEAESLAREVVSWIDRELGRSYGWPGNVRELEQCVRSVLVRGSYHPAAQRGESGARDLVELLRAGRVTADDLVRRYCTHVYAETRNYEETARRLGLDRRTVKAKVDPELLATLRPVPAAASDAR